MGSWDGSGISWTICKQSAPLLQRDNHINTSSLNFYRPGALPDAQPTASKHWRHHTLTLLIRKHSQFYSLMVDPNFWHPLSGSTLTTHRAFWVADPMAWNSLPDFISDSTSNAVCFRLSGTYSKRTSANSISGVLNDNALYKSLTHFTTNVCLISHQLTSL